MLPSPEASPVSRRVVVALAVALVFAVAMVRITTIRVAGASGPTLINQTVFGGPADQSAAAVVVSGGQLMLAGTNPAGVGTTAWGFTIPPGAAPAWTNVLPAHATIVAAAPDPNGGMIAVGGCIPSSCGAVDNAGTVESKAGILKFDTAGNLVFAKSANIFAYSGFEALTGVAATTENAATVAYATGVAEPCSSGIAIVTKFDANGNLVAKATEPGLEPDFITSCAVFEPNTSATATGIVADGAAEYVVGASASRPDDSDSTLRPVLLKYDTSLNRLWKQRSADVAGQLLAVTEANGALYAAGVATGASNDFLIQKYDLDGHRLWSQSSGGAGDDSLTGVVVMHGRLFAVGQTSSSGAGAHDGVLLEIDPSTGATLSSTLSGGPNEDGFNSVTTDGVDLYAAGFSRSDTTNGNGAGEMDGALVRYHFDPVTTTTTVSAAANPSVFGQPVTFSATTTANGSAVTIGSITLKDGGTIIAGPTPVNAGTLSFVTATLSVGSHTMTAEYDGNAGYAASTATTLTQTVNKNNTTTQLVSSPNPSASGGQITIVATVTPVSPASLTPSGSVTIIDGPSTLAVVPLNAGTATFQTSALTVGTHTIGASYAGDSGFNGSTAPAVTQSVTRATGVTLSSSLNPSAVGQQVTYSATIPGTPISFNTPGGLSNSFSTRSTDVGDVNGDGKLDFVEGSGEGVGVMLGNGAGGFASVVEVPVTGGASGLLLRDFDGDGKLDLAVVSYNTAVLNVYLGAGDGTFPQLKTSVSTTPGHAPGGALAAGDYDGDGVLDLAVLNGEAPSANVFKGAGDGTFALTHVLNGPNASFPGVAFADVNGDGRADLELAGDGGVVNVYLSLGNDGFGSLLSVLGVGQTTSGLAVGDVNGDGKTDLVTANYSSSNVSVLFGNGDGTFGSQATYPVAANPLSLALGDINGDGKLDIAVGHVSGQLSVLQNSGTGTFAPALSTSIPGLVYALALADVNGDHLPDLIVLPQQTAHGSLFLNTSSTGGTMQFSDGGTNIGGPVALTGATASVTMLPGGGSHSIMATYSGTSINAPSTATFSQTVGKAGSATRVASSLSPANLTDAVTFTATVRPLGLPPAFALPVQFSIPAQSANTIVTGDFNEDGKPDIITISTTNSSTSSVWLNLGNGRGGTSRQLQYSANCNTPTMAAVGDFNGDHHLDVAIACTTIGGVVVEIGDGAGGLTLAGKFPSAGNSFGVAVGDVTGDGIPDIVAVNTANTMVVLRGNGDATFAIAGTFPTNGISPRGIVLADFNGDGHLDVATANITSNTVTVFLNSGTGAQYSTSTYPVGAIPIRLAAADVNGDGLPEIAVADEGTSDAVTVLLNNGLGAFNTSTSVGSNGAMSVALADLNGDGLADLAFGSLSLPSLTIYTGNGDGSFSGGVSLVEPGARANLVPVDLNGDGRLDLATVVALTSQSAIGELFLNTTPTLTWPPFTGAVQFTDTIASVTTPLGGPVALVNGMAALTTSALPGGQHTIAAVYAGDGNFTPSTGTVPETVNAIDSATTLTGDGTILVGQPAHFTATVTGGGGPVTSGTVSLLDGSTLLTPQPAPLDASGHATFTINGLGLGTHSMLAIYNGSAGFRTSQGTAAEIVVNVVDSTATIAANVNPSTFGQIVTFTASVVSTAGPVTDGTITFQDGSNVLAGPTALDGNGQASVSTAALNAGPHVITAAYSGGAHANPSTAQMNQAVSPAQPAIAIATAAATFDGNPHTTTASATGIHGETLAGTFGFSYSPGGFAAPANAGAYDVTASFSSQDPNYANGSATRLHAIDIDPRAPDVTVTGGSFTYNDAGHQATGNATGLGGAPVPGSFAFTYTPGGSAAPTTVGGYSVLGTFTSRDPNYTGGSASSSITITASPVTMNGPMSVTVEAHGPPPGSAEANFMVMAFDLDGSLTPTCSATSGSTFPFGTTTVTCTAQGANSAPGSLTFPVIVRDTTAPAIPPLSTVQADATSSAGAIVTFPLPTSTDAVDAHPVVTTSPLSGSPFAHGDTTVTVTATDASGNRSMQTFTVHVNASLVSLGTTADDGASTATINVNQTKQFVATGHFTDGSTQSNGGGGGAQGPAWRLVDSMTGLDSNIGTIDGNGLATGLAPGTALVDAKSGGISCLTSMTCATLTVETFSPSFAVSSQTITYGDGTATFAGTLSAGGHIPAGTSIAIAVNGLNTTASLDASGAFSASLDTHAFAASSYAVTYRFSGTATFDPATDAATSLTVHRKQASVSADPRSKTYGDANPALTATVAGVINGDTLNVTLSTTAMPSSGVGAYPITVSPGNNPNYDVQASNGSLTISKAALRITADNKSRQFGVANPPLTAAYTGFVNGEGPAALDTPLSLTTTATQASPAGTYPITASGAADANYAITFANGTLTIVDTTAPVLQLPASITTDASSSAGAVVTFTATATDAADGARPVTCTPASGATFPIGTTTVSCSASDTHGNTATGTFTVTVNNAEAPGHMLGAGAVPQGRDQTLFAFDVQERVPDIDRGFLTLDAPASRGRSIFVSLQMTSVVFSDDPGFRPGHAPPTIDTVHVGGVGVWNGHAGYTFVATATDQGEPGRGHDTFAVTIRDPHGVIVETATGTISAGNIQSLRLPGRR